MIHFYRINIECTPTSQSNVYEAFVLSCTDVWAQNEKNWEKVRAHYKMIVLRREVTGAWEMGREISGQSVLTWTVCSAGKQREEKDFSRVSPKHKISRTLHTQSITHTHFTHNLSHTHFTHYVWHNLYSPLRQYHAVNLTQHQMC